ncbi:MAG: hypothetical protein II932_04315, partial [Treponema sp.]|nr:hypothetical protein [Treponema sp.]
TRAKDGLFLSDSEGRANDNLFKYPSRFIFDAGLENLELVKPLPDDLARQSREIIAYDKERLRNMRTLLAQGDRVRHPVFSEGTIQLVNTAASCYTVKFDSIATARSIQFAARLERVQETPDTESSKSRPSPS